MIPITRGDDELYHTVLVAARLGQARRIIERLNARYEQEWDQPLAGFPYALSMVALMQVALTESSIDDGQAVARYSEIVESLTDLLHGSPDHWLGRYLRIRVRAMMMPAHHVEHPQFAAAERTRAAADADDLIARQARAAWQPWFACSYLLAARLAWESDDRDPVRVAELVSGAVAQPATPIPFPALGGLLGEAFIWYCQQPEVPDRDRVSRMLGIMLPDQTAARATLLRSPR